MAASASPGSERESGSPNEKASVADVDTSSNRSITPHSHNNEVSKNEKCASHQHLAKSSDTLQHLSCTNSGEEVLESASAIPWPEQEEEEYQDVLPSSQPGVAARAAKSASETVTAKRMLVASFTSPQEGWEIMQGKGGRQLEEQVSALGLEGMRNCEDSETASDITRTPSQSTTGTVDSSITGSLSTAASSLPSTTCSSDTALHKADAVVAVHSASPLRSSSSSSPEPFSTPRSSSEEDRSLLRHTIGDGDKLRRYHALLELVETEKGYADDLAILVNVFFHNLSTQAFFDETPARLKAVCRNADDLVNLHAGVARQMIEIIDEYSLSAESPGSDMDKAARSEDAVIQIARRLTRAAVEFDAYQLFCSRHAEALILIREAEKRHNGDDFAAFERMCGNQLRGLTRTIARSTPSSSRRSSTGATTPLAVHTSVGGEDSSSSTATSAAPTISRPPSGSTTPSGSFASMSRQTTGRLLFADYLIKPIQRLCLYPLVLNSLLKYTPNEEVATRQALEGAITSMRRVADDVDKASKQREKDLMSDLLTSRIEMQLQGVTLPFVKSLGNPLLSGALDVLYHHETANPLAAPLRFQRLGLILWHGFLLFVRVRKNHQLECKYWLPLSYTQLSALDDNVSPGTESSPWTTSAQATRPLVPFALRLSYYNSHFELAASSERERRVWHRHIELAIEKAPSSAESSYPSNLPDDLTFVYPAPSASLLSFYIANVKASAMTPDTIVKLPSPSTRAAVDRNMIFSDVLSSPFSFSSALNGSTGTFGPVGFSQKDLSDALLAQQLRQNAAPSIGSAVGAAMGLARLAAREMPTAVKRVRRQSMLNLTEINPACDALLPASPTTTEGQQSNIVSSGSVSKRNSHASIRLSSSAGMEGVESGVASSGKWKGTLLRRGSKVLRRNSGSVPPSPMTSTMDLNQTLEASAPLCASPSEELRTLTITTDMAPHGPKRSKSMSLRDIWQSSMGRRSRSQSINSEAGSILSPHSTTVSLISSPILDGEVKTFGDNTSRPDRDQSQSSSLKDTLSNRHSLSSADLLSSSSSSVAQLRRILSTSSSSGQAAMRSFGRSKTVRAPVAAPVGPNVSSKVQPVRGKIERSQTEIMHSTSNWLVSGWRKSHDYQDRRSSEPDAFGVMQTETRNSSSSSKGATASNSLRRAAPRASFAGSSAPASILEHFSNSWSDHSRLNSVEETTAEISEGAIHDQKEQKSRRPALLRRPSSADC